MTIQTIIVAYNSSLDLERCLESLHGEGTSVVVVDNSVDQVERLRTRQVASDAGARYVGMAENRGFAAGVNAGVAAADVCEGDWIWLLNPDTEVKRGCARLLEAAARNASSAVVSPLITTGDNPERVWFAGGDLDLKRGRCVHRDYGAPVDQLRLARSECTFITGAAVMMSARLWVQLGGLREDLFMYWEDADLSRRAVEAGARLMVVPDARVWHRVGGSAAGDGMSELYHYYMQRNRYVLAAEEARSALTPLWTAGVEIAKSLVVAVAREPSGRRRKLWASVRGLLAGISIAMGSAAVVRDHRMASA